MALKLEDLLNKKKEPGSSILDLSKVKIKSNEDFEKYFDKIPEFKIRPEKVTPYITIIAVFSIQNFLNLLRLTGEI